MTSLYGFMAVLYSTSDVRVTGANFAAYDGDAYGKPGASILIGDNKDDRKSENDGSVAKAGDAFFLPIQSHIACDLHFRPKYV